MTNNVDLYELPLNLLKRSKTFNVRKSGHSKAALEFLADTIKVEGLRHPLTVTPEIKARGKGAERVEEHTGSYEVVAGAGRFGALGILVTRGDRDEAATVLCHIVSREEALGMSYTENAARTEMHPADEFEAFKALEAEGRSIMDIAARFHVTERTVRERLKLASVAKEFIKAFREDKLDLDVLMALSLSENHDEQRAAVKACGSRVTAWRIRDHLTQGEVASDHSLVKFVTEAAYVEAGGSVRGSLFEDKAFYDFALLHELAEAKLVAAEQKQVAHGANWVERVEDHFCVYNNFKALGKDASANELELAGSVIQLTQQGKLNVYKNMLRMKDVKRLERIASKKSGNVEGSTEVVSDAMAQKLSVHRTFAIQAELMARPDVALASTVAELVTSTFPALFDRSSDAVGVDIRGSALSIKERPGDVLESEAVKQLADAHERWAALLSAIPVESPLLEWLIAQPQATLLDLLAYCIARRTSAITFHASTPTPADAIAVAVGLDMHKWWKATGDTFFAALPKASLAAIIKDVSATVVSPSDHNKAELVALTEAAVADGGYEWLPAPLRK